MTDKNKYIDISKKGENPFTVPSDYFAGFEDRFMDDFKKKEGDFNVPMLKMMKPYLYIAAGFLLLFTIGRTVLTSVDTSNDNVITAQTLSAEEELELLYSEVDDFTITNYLLENDLNDAETE